MRRGFTLIDVLVTLAVISVLLSILMPSLSSVRETARQVVCRSNVRQVGIGLVLYAEAYQDRVPYSGFLEGPNPTPHETVILRRVAPDSWDGAGHLYDDYMAAPQVFYCPSHRGSHPYRAYADAWMLGAGLIVGNFQYRGKAPIDGGATTALTSRLGAMRPGTTLLVDGFRTAVEFNHGVGANRFRADASVSWFGDRVNGGIVSLLPKDDQSGIVSPQVVEDIWEELDR
ncbi:MAG: type II secretion system protein [Phycisphaerales bacterium]